MQDLTMTAIALLKSELAKKGKRALAGFPAPDTTAIEAETAALAEWLEAATGLHTPPLYRIRAALVRFHAERKIADAWQARHLCHGCLVLYSRRAPWLMEDARAFPLLLQYVDNLHNRTRLFRRCFQGLMRAYFTYEPGRPDPAAGPYHNRETGWKNRLLLRAFLQRRRNCITAPGFNPDWVQAVMAHPDLFNPNPCQAYVQAALQQDFSAFNALCDRLKINRASWFARGLVYEQVDAITQKPDDEFRQHLTNSIDLLSKHSWSADKGLTKLINRYAASEQAETNASLRDFSLSQWKNPWLAKETRGWQSVSEKAREMVSAWTKEHLIHQFFWMLAEGTQYDVRRAAFWAQYFRQIKALYFALGSQAAGNSSRDFIRLRQAMEGFLLGLEHAGRTDRNACIFMIGHYAIVEFGANHLPAYIYDRRSQLPFELRRGFKVTSAELRNQRAAAFVQTLAHEDTDNTPWEAAFAQALERLHIRTG